MESSVTIFFSSPGDVRPEREIASRVANPLKREFTAHFTLSSNASKEWSGKFDDLKKKQDALRRKVKQIVKEHKITDQKERGKSITDKKRLEKRIKKFTQQADRIEPFLTNNEPKIGSKNDEIQRVVPQIRI